MSSRPSNGFTTQERWGTSVKPGIFAVGVGLASSTLPLQARASMHCACHCCTLKVACLPRGHEAKFALARRYKPGDYVRVKVEDSSVRYRKPHLRTPGALLHCSTPSSTADMVKQDELEAPYGQACLPVFVCARIFYSCQTLSNIRHSSACHVYQGVRLTAWPTVSS